MPESQGQRENKSVRITLFLRAQTVVLKIVRVVGQRVSYLRLGGRALGATTQFSWNQRISHRRKHPFI